MRAAGTPPVHIAGRGQDGDLQLHRGVVQSRPSPFWHPLSIPNRLRDTGAQGGPNDLSDKPSTKPGQLQLCNTPTRIPDHIKRTFVAGSRHASDAMRAFGVGEWYRQTLGYRLDTERAK